MITETVISPILDEKIKDHVCTSSIWKNCYKPEEITSDLWKSHPILYSYQIKFEGLKPVQCIKIDVWKE